MTRTSEPRPLLLDTHVWLWFMLANPKLAISEQSVINRAAASGQLRIAAISVWEAALLASRGRVALSRPLAQWMTEAVSAPGLSIEPLLPQVAVEASLLPETFHRDPGDRLIVATARVTKATLMTRDRRILDYAAGGHLTALAA
jgi:PIN domain nuclease of toxin-antitoxin system